VRNYYSTIAATLNYWSGPKNNMGIGIGGYFGLLHKSKLTVEEITPFGTRSITTFQQRKYNEFDAGLIVSLNYRILVSEQITLNLALQHERGVVDIIKDRDVRATPISSKFENATIMHQSFSLYVGLLAKLPKPKRMATPGLITIKSRAKNFFSEVYVLGGPAVSFLRGNSIVERTFMAARKAKLSFNYSIGATHKISTQYFLDIQILSENKGGISVIKTDWYDETTQTTITKEIPTKYNYKCVTLPVAIGYAPGEKARLKIGAGLFLSYLAHVSNSYNPWTRKIDAGIITYGQYSIPMNSLLSLNISAINTNGLLNVSRIYTRGLAIKTNCTSVLVGISKKIGK
jgi:hypothetical protein